MKTRFDQGDTCNTVRVEGDLNIFSAAELKAVLLQAIDEGKDFCLNVQDIKDFDCIALQLLVAAKRTASNQGLQFQFDNDVPPLVLSMADELGIDRNLLP